MDSRSTILGAFALLLSCSLVTGCRGVGSDQGAISDGGGHGLPTMFQDCATPSCVVSLEAFMSTPSGTVPHCPNTRSDDAAFVDQFCNSPSASSNVLAGACGDLYVYRIVYGFPGDNYRCVFSAVGQLVGADWSPDSHPKQVAGTQPPATCEPRTSPCAGTATDAAMDAQGDAL